MERKQPPTPLPSAAHVTVQSDRASADTVANRRKCPVCGLVNVAANEECRRCGAVLPPVGPVRIVEAEPAVQPSRAGGIGRRLLWLAGVTVVLVFLWSRSLLLTSDAIDGRQQQIVLQAVTLLERSGFSREVLVLRHFANYRATDNWWNLYLGHPGAYAATNFPLGVVTLYPAFFTTAVDDTERAAILLHEAQHLWGSGEEAALDRVWRNKQRLGWTADQYGQTRVWRNTREWTVAALPALFQCGADHQSECDP
jgi:hypothetical protein